MAKRKFSGHKLRDARDDAFLSQRDLGEKAGVNYVTIARLETNEDREPQARTVRKLAEALGVPPLSLFDVTDEETAT